MSEVRKIQIQDGKGNIYHPQTVSEQVLGLDKRLEGLAKETYVDEQIAAIPEVDLTGIENNILTLEENKADKTELDKKANKTELDKKADKTDVTSQLSLKADKTELNKKADKTELTPMNKEIDNLKSSGVESNRIMVEALNSKGVQASIDNSIRENANKINDIKVGDYSIGDICKRVEEVWEVGEALEKPLEIWAHSLESIPRSMVTGADGHVYIGNDDSVIKMTGDRGVTWESKIFPKQISSLEVDKNNNVICGSSDMTKITKLNHMGRYVWEYETGEYVRDLTVNSLGEILVGKTNRDVQKVSSLGQFEWDYTINYDYGNVSQLASYGSDFYISTYEGNIIKLASDKKVLWNESRHESRVSALETTVDGDIVSSHFGVVKKTSSKGSHLWSYTGHSDNIEDLSSDQKNNVYSGSNDETIRKISPSGSMVWSQLFTYYPALLSADNIGHLYTCVGQSLEKLQVDEVSFLGYKILE